MTISRTAVRLPALALGILLCTIPAALAVAPPGLIPEEAKGRDASLTWPPDPSLVRHPEPILLPEDPVEREAAVRGHRGFRELLEIAPGWKGTLDPYTGSVDRAFGEGLALAGGDAPEGAEDGPARMFLSRFHGLLAPELDLSPASLVLNEAASVALPDPSARIVQFDLHKDGVPVLGAGATLAVREGRVFYLSTSALAPVAAAAVPKLGPEAGLASVLAYLDAASAGGGKPRLVREPSLAFHPRLDTVEGRTALRHRLVWILEVRPEEAEIWEGYIAWVDAHDGSLLAFFPEARHAGACSADPKQAHGTVTGGVRANRADDPEKMVHLPFARVEVDGRVVTTDINGRYLYRGGSATSTLDGTFFRARCSSCTSPAGAPAAAVAETGRVDFGLGGASQPAPVTGNGASTPADRTAFFQLNQARLLLGKWNNAFFSEIDSFVNIPSTCNAFSSAYMLGFFAGGGSCRNTGENRDVVQHELGHTWDRTDGTGITDGGLSEWKGDLLAHLMGGDSCIGESFRLSGGPTSVCTGVRDIDEKAPGRVDHPLTPSQCATCATLTRTSHNCGTGVHCLGEIAGQASWHLMHNLQGGVDYITGAAFPAGNPAFSAEQTRWILERLLIGGGPAMRVWNPTASGVSLYDAVMLADDDDGNLANGTPHAAYINAAFAHHQIEESPLVADAPNCAPLSDPVVTPSVERDPATGLPTVRLQWTPIGGATTFDVYRNTRAGDAFLPLAQNLTGTSFLDRGVQVGATFRYFVAAVRKTGCATISPGANVLSLTVAPPELVVSAKVLSESPAGSDLDGLFEPGERVSVQLTLGETGGVAGATNVTATLASASSVSSPVIAGGPIAFGNVSAGGTAAGSAPFEVLIGPGESCGSKPHFVASVTADEGCWLIGIDVPLATIGCQPSSSSAFVHVVPGSPRVVGGDGDGDGIADNCETTTVEYLVRNAGAVASGPVVSSAATSHPGVTFVPRQDCVLSDLGPGATAPCTFRFSLGSATTSGVPFTLTATSAANPAPSTHEFVLGAEANPHVFSTLFYGFEAAEGWTFQQWGIALGRRVSGFRSLFAGSPSTSNICGKATSPAFLLDPAATSTLGFWVYTDIEPSSGGGQWFDRANVHLVDVDAGTHTLLTPASGLAYNASGNPSGGLCHVAGQNGWAGSTGGVFQQVFFDLAPFAGRRVRIEFNYGSDDETNLPGIWIDDLTLTNAALATAPPDPQADGCSVPEVSATGAAVPLRASRLPADVVQVGWQDLGAAYQYNLYAGSLGGFYSHGASTLSCQGVGAGILCDGSVCSIDLPLASLPLGDVYLLATATGFGVEGTSGFASNGAERDPLQSTCAP